ncbi:hypothetical protein ACE6H2_011985 [Prunus campanulata]
MESEDFIGLSPSGDSLCVNVNDEPNNSLFDSKEVDSQPTNSEDKEDKLKSENLGNDSDVQHEVSHCVPEENLENELVGSGSDMEIEDISNLPALNRSGSADEEIKIKGNKKGDAHCLQQANHNNDLFDKSSLLSVAQSETVTVAQESNIFCSKVHRNGCLPVQDASPFGTHKTGGTTISGVKRARITVDERQPSVRVTYKSLTRASKHKLEELLQQWSEWHAQHVPSSQDPIEVVESGEDTFFPALHVGTEKTSAVSFWMDNQTRNAESKESTPLDSNYVPLYDRGYALGLTLAGGSSNLEGGLEIIDDASRCFNCGSYNHSLKDCPKPRNHVAVNNARKQLKFKRNQNANSRNSARYYQNSPAGKYDGLRPGALDAETRKLLGIGELDPPPWLNRMREIGYPPGYLDPDDEDQPSGIIIYADEEIKGEQEDGEIIETDYPEPERKMTVEFPGLNGPIPENADERLWAPGPLFSDHSRNRSYSRSNHYSEPVSRGHHREQRWSRDYRDDGPPGVEPGSGPSSYPPRYGSYDYGYNLPRSPTFGRSQSDRGRRIPLSNEGSFPYSNPRLSPKDYDSANFENWNDESRSDYDLDSSTRDRLDRHRHHRRRLDILKWTIRGEVFGISTVKIILRHKHLYVLDTNTDFHVLVVGCIAMSLSRLSTFRLQSLINCSVVLFMFFNFFQPFVHPLSFSINDFGRDANNILYEGDAAPSSGVIELSTITAKDIQDICCRTGRATYAEPLHLWDSAKLADFTTNFSFIIDTVDNDTNDTVDNDTNIADGLVFFLASVHYPIPPNSAGLGLLNTTTRFDKASQNQIVMVEFDTLPNSWDPPWPHVGININTISSVVNASWDALGNSGKKAHVQITYSATTKNLTVFWTYEEYIDVAITSLSYPIDLRKVLPEWVTIGFSTSSGCARERNAIYTWDFRSNSKESSTKKERRLFWIGAVAVSVFILILGVAICWLVVKRQINRIDEHGNESNSVASTDLVWQAFPRRFSYKELVAATNDFANDRRLGQGGSGKVYKGIIQDLGCTVAVKRIIPESEHYEKVFINEGSDYSNENKKIVAATANTRY